MNEQEVKLEPEEAEICLPADRHLHSSSSDSHPTLGGALEPTEPQLDPDCVKTQWNLSPGKPADQTSHLRRTGKGAHPGDVTLRSQQDILVKNEAKEGSITEFKNDPADCFDNFLEEFIKQKTKEEAVNLNKTEEILLLSECEASGSRFCRTFMYKRSKISNGDGTPTVRRGGTPTATEEQTVAPTLTSSAHVRRPFSKPNTSHGADEGQRTTKSKSCKDADKKDDGAKTKKHCCELCGRGYTHKFHLGLHMRIHRGEKHCRCTECGAAFHHNGQLQAHMKVHTGKKPFTCDKCGKTFSRSGNLIAHQRVHTGERPHRCTECARCYKSARDLRRHQMIHTGDKPSICSECGKGFLRPATLRKHMRIHTGERPYFCSECGKTFPYAFSYKTHLKTHRRATSTRATLKRTGKKRERNT